MQVGDMGYAAYFKDTEGNIIGLWQTINQSKISLNNVGIGVRKYWP